MAYEPVISSQDIDELYEAMLQLKDKEECYRFFEDLCTIHEVQAMAQRLKVAKMLKNGEGYHEIVEETHASTATISRINRCLIYGAGGYRLMLRRLASANEKAKDE